MTHARTLTCLAIAAVLAGSIAGTAAAQTAGELAELTATGFSHVGNDIWQSIDDDGVVRRIGFGVNSEQALLDNLRDISSQASDNGLGGDLGQSIAHLHQSIAAIEEKRMSNQEKSGGFGSCALPPLDVVSATIHLPTRTATAAVSGGGFGPPEPGWVRIASAVALPSGNPFAIEGTLATESFAHSIDVTATADPSPSTCTFYAYAHVFRVYADCGAWTDAYLQVASC